MRPSFSPLPCKTAHLEDLLEPPVHALPPPLGGEQVEGPPDPLLLFLLLLSSIGLAAAVALQAVVLAEVGEGGEQDE